MEKFFAFMERVFMGPMAKISNQKHMLAVRNGMISTIPLTIVGSFFLILAFPPFPVEILTKYQMQILVPYRMTMGLIAIFATYNIAYNLSKSYKLDGVSGGTLALIAFMLTHIPVMAVLPDESKAMVLPVLNLGGAGLFVGILMAFFAVEVLRFFKVRKLVIRMPEGVPEAVSRSFEALFPTVFIVLVVSLITVILSEKFGTNLHKLVYIVFQPLERFVNHPLGVVLMVLLITLLWACGIHGVAVIGSVARPIWINLLDQNIVAQTNGVLPPNVAPEPFYQWFVWIGGSGCTIGLLLLMCISKSKQLKSLGYMAFLPGIFNINEPIIFGTPIVMNPFLIFPFMLAPLVNALLTYFLMSANLVSRVVVLAPWTLPAPLGAFLATGADMRAVILVMINILISVLIYLPFFKLYEKNLLEKEAAGVATEAADV